MNSLFDKISEVLDRATQSFIRAIAPRSASARAPAERPLQRQRQGRAQAATVVGSPTYVPQPPAVREPSGMAPVEEQRALYIVDRGVFVRGLIMNRVTRDGRIAPHWGVDIGAPEGTPVHAMASGIVLFARALRGYGNAVMIQHSGGKSTLYGHLQRSLVQEGQRVQGGGTIGLVGSTRSGRNIQIQDGRIVSVGAESAGAVTQPISPHLHMEVHPTAIPNLGPRARRLDPVAYLRSAQIGLVGEQWRPTRRS